MCSRSDGTKTKMGIATLHWLEVRVLWGIFPIACECVCHPDSIQLCSRVTSLSSRNNAGRHSYHLNINPPLDWDPTVTVAHEFGHIFGLEHEHQRADREQYTPCLCYTLLTNF